MAHCGTPTPSGSSAPHIDRLAHTVQCNCHISDARYAGNYSLCIYLLKMRELFRWEQGFELTDGLPREAVGAWLSEREELWDDLVEAAYAPLALSGGRIDPFEADPVNDWLVPQGYVYGGGIGAGGKPLFFLGRLRDDVIREGLRVLVVDHELARDLAAPPAMLQGKTVYLRRESLRRALWERVEGWLANRRPGSRRTLLTELGFEDDPAAALENLTEQEAESAVLHEIGEARAGERLGDAWEEMLVDLGRSRAEFTARAVRDHLADCLVTLPALLERDDDRALRFYLASLDGIRRELFPRLVDDGAGARHVLRETAISGRRHWQEIAERLLDAWRSDGREGPERVVADARLALH